MSGIDSRSTAEGTTKQTGLPHDISVSMSGTALVSDDDDTEPDVLAQGERVDVQTSLLVRVLDQYQMGMNFSEKVETREEKP